MIIWLASYPKSGNTFLRSLLSSYFFSENGRFSFELLKHIQQYPNTELFMNLGVDINDKIEVAKNYIKTQEIINKLSNIQFWKTHSSFCEMFNQYNFSDLKNSLGVIYVVRDPRNVATSFANHNSKSIDETIDLMMNDLAIGNEKDEVDVYMGSWSFNYNSWKIFKPTNRYLLIKYEDLISNTKQIFINIIKFINRVSNSTIQINEKKINNILETTNFDYMQKLEAQYGFKEAKINEKTGKKVNFFNLGPKNDWKNSLKSKSTKNIELKFKTEMKELGYL